MISREEYEAKLGKTIMERRGISLQEYLDEMNMVIVPCSPEECEWSGCEGWRMEGAEFVEGAKT